MLRPTHEDEVRAVSLVDREGEVIEVRRMTNTAMACDLAPCATEVAIERNPKNPSAIPQPAGWLYVGVYADQHALGTSRHFCPECATKVGAFLGVKS